MGAQIEMEDGECESKLGIGGANSPLGLWRKRVQSGGQGLESQQKWQVQETGMALLRKQPGQETVATESERNWTRGRRGVVSVVGHYRHVKIDAKRENHQVPLKKQNIGHKHSTLQWNCTLVPDGDSTLKFSLYLLSLSDI